MNPRFRYMLVGALCAIMFQTCKKAQPSEEIVTTYQCAVNSVAGHQDDALGKWKLLSHWTVFYNPHTTDYSCDDIIYEFKREGGLTVTSTVDEPYGYAAGDYPFELKANVAPEDDNMYYTLQIGEHSPWPATIGTREMILSQAYLDGPVLHFVRIE
ncbi:hypothetical protein [Parapedobacter sp. 10938]|uniref:hypothetical protein n=1 Tax=Parapedobacter flavus TaxID=3110225 RepID=UPI002DB59A0D|nr:hypothetical protein [Parapedobacter sp. 10938]MEC3881491.1 hypothetical protein [Parapedobacter sp. 10938]